MSQYAHLSDPDPEFSDAFSKLPIRPPPLDPLQAIRGLMTDLAATTKTHNRSKLPDASSYSVEDCKITVKGGEITIRCTKPTPTSGEVPAFPVLFWAHGGGCVSGDLELDDFPNRILCAKYRISIVSVDYRLAPEHPFPIGLNDCYSALKWVGRGSAQYLLFPLLMYDQTVENAPRIFGDPTKGFLVGGNSAGAYLATVVAHRARDDAFFRNHKVTGQILQYPRVLARAASPPQYKDQLLSMEQNKDGPGLTAASIDWIAGLVKAPPADPEYSPLLAAHEGLAPAYIQVCGLDPLRDEALLYERLLREAGVKTKLDIYPGVPHGFNFAFPQLAASVKFEADLNFGLAWLLDAKV
ncbi:Alpha/Beta hydrolase protein [Mycena maculata]|uniref:Alpha/Beta hydrolase protein n=1 Tax=Mycena maculata TaxID=230809 RepID=A0AAD7INX8_9AGAR|nr:Alpha/Beta hydrolase protein [Mycena maculata]